jgi:hypothetical protein
MTKHRFTTLTITAALALGLPASASARPVYDNGLVGASPQGTPADGTDLTMPLAGGSLALLLAGAGFVRYRVRTASGRAATGGHRAAV